jgi:hypothetical protein
MTFLTTFLTNNFSAILITAILVLMAYMPFTKNIPLKNLMPTNVVGRFIMLILWLAVASSAGVTQGMEVEVLQGLNPQIVGCTLLGLSLTVILTGFYLYLTPYAFRVSNYGRGTRKVLVGFTIYFCLIVISNFDKFNSI